MSEMYWFSILISGVTEEAGVAAFELSDYDQVPVKTVLQNNGHSAKISADFSSWVLILYCSSVVYMK